MTIVKISFYISVSKNASKLLFVVIYTDVHTRQQVQDIKIINYNVDIEVTVGLYKSQTLFRLTSLIFRALNFWFPFIENLF